MDPISIGIIVTVLSLGTVLIYLFKLDFDRIRNSHRSSTISNKVQSNGNIKVQPVKPTKQTYTIHHQEILANHHSNVTKQQFQDDNHISHDKTHGTQNLRPKQQPTIKIAKKANNHNNSNNNEHATSKANLTIVPYQDSCDMFPHLEELDPSTLPVISNQAKNKKVGQQVNNPTPKNNKKRQTTPDPTNYSPEQLFKMIAASSLSHDDIKSAVEILLNKIESGDSDWKQPKNDPLQKLRNQLKESQSALQIEQQNHEQSRARVNELRQQLQSERSSLVASKEDQVKAQKELGLVTVLLDGARHEIKELGKIIDGLKLEREASKDCFDREKVELENRIKSSSVQDEKFTILHQELAEKEAQVKRFELSNQALTKNIHELESALKSTEAELNNIKAGKQHDDYEAGAKIAELEAECLALKKAFNDQGTRLKETIESKCSLDKLIKEMQIVNGHQEEMLKRLKDERQVNEDSMRRALNEMGDELKELQSKLSFNSAKHKQEINDISIRKDDLGAVMSTLRNGLESLFPDLKIAPETDGINWAVQYLDAIKQLAKSVDELRDEKNNNITTINGRVESPGSKSLASKSASSPRQNGNVKRVGSPTSYGRISKAGSHHERSDGDRKLAETKLLEVNHEELSGSD